MSADVDRLHGDAICARGLLLCGNDRTDRRAAEDAVAMGIDRLASELTQAIKERDAAIALIGKLRVMS